MLPLPAPLLQPTWLITTETHHMVHRGKGKAKRGLCRGGGWGRCNSRGDGSAWGQADQALGRLPFSAARHEASQHITGVGWGQNLKWKHTVATLERKITRAMAAACLIYSGI